MPQGTKVRREASGTVAVLSTAWLEADGEDGQNMVLLRTDAEDRLLETFTVGGPNHVQAFDFDLTPDAGFLMAGHTVGFGVANWDCVVGLLGADGTMLWLEVFGDPRGYDPAWVHDECYGIRTLPDGRVVLVGGTGDEYDEYSATGHPSGSSDEGKAYVVFLDPEGQILTEAVYGDPDMGSNATEYAALTADGGLMLFNDTDSEGSMAPINFGFMKLRPTG